MTKTFEAKDWYLMFSSLVKTHLPEGASVQLWLRVDGDGKKKPECFENMYESRIKGTTAWNQHAVAVDVPVASQKITYGILLTGTGQVWLDDVTLEPVEGEIVIVATKGSTLAHILLIENARKHAPMML